MKKLLLFAAAALVLSSCAGGKTTDQKPQSFAPAVDHKAIGVDQSRLARIDTLLQDYVDRGIIPHALTFVARGGEIIHHKAFGWRDIEGQIPLATDDIFRMYSQTKAITTVALLTLFEKGLFQLDDPVSRYIPEMTDQVYIDPSDRANTKTRKAASPVTIRQLLAHSSGIAGIRTAPDAPRKVYETLEEYVRELVAAPLVFDPGTGWYYNPSADVWGYLVEYFSGKPLQEYVKEAVLDPLGITDMAWYFDAPYAERFVTGYDGTPDGGLQAVEFWSGRNPFQEDRRYAASGTGLSGTIEGYARFCQMILNHGTFNGHRILSRHTVEMMRHNQLRPGAGGNDFLFGLGFQIYPQEETGHRAIANFTPMVSAGALHWGGAANTDYIIDHSEDMIILLYTNRRPDTRVWEKYLNTVYQALE